MKGARLIASDRYSRLLVRDLAAAILSTAGGRYQSYLAQRVQLSFLVNDILKEEFVEIEKITKLFSNNPLGTTKQKLKYLIEGPRVDSLGKHLKIVDQCCKKAATYAKTVASLASFGKVDHVQTFVFQELLNLDSGDAHNSATYRKILALKPVFNVVCALNMMKITSLDVFESRVKRKDVEQAVFAAKLFGEAFARVTSFHNRLDDEPTDPEQWPEEGPPPPRRRHTLMLGTYKGIGLTFANVSMEQRLKIKQDVTDYLSIDPNVVEKYNDFERETNNRSALTAIGG